MAGRYVHGANAAAIPPFFPLTPVLADSPILFVMLGAFTLVLARGARPRVQQPVAISGVGARAPQLSRS
jgi:hypothetical protein